MLTVKRVARLLKRPGRYLDAHGLRLVVRGPNNASWILRFQVNGRERYMGLGPVHLVSLNDAGKRAWEARRLLLDGIDPLATRQEAKATRALVAAKTQTFEAAVRAYYQQHEPKWQSVTRKQFLASLERYAFPLLGHLPVADIDTGLVLKVVEPIWRIRTETASRVRGRIEAVLDWATVRGYRAGDNPARWRGHLGEVLPAPNSIAKVEHHDALPYAQIGQFVAELRQREGIGSRALEFLILTAMRTTEVIGARWNEIDLATATWTVPAGRMKERKEHRVPLAPRAIELLNGLPREGGNNFVFLGRSKGSGIANSVLRDVLELMGQKGTITVHGFRSTFRDWAADQTNYANHIVELALAHKVGGVEGAYRRGELFEKRTRLMADWARYCAMPSAVVGEVVPIRGR